jgi:2-oxoglutarate/2-oxoacid ferredoxin oxidoreductase subunit beta
VSQVVTNGEHKKLTKKDFESDQAVRWCPGCGDYAILAQMQKVMPELGIPKEKIVFISGIGCSSRFPYYMDTFGFHTIHGRAPAIATGLKLARPDLTVWVVTGDGDALSIGGNHLIHALRRNVDLKILLFNNKVYGLTKGQFSPTSEVGMKTKSSPAGSVARPFRTLSLALGAEATFVARAVDTETQHLQEMISRMAQHKGAALLEIYQNCPVFNDGAFEELKDRKTKSDHLLFLEQGKPLVFGKDDERVVKLDTERTRLYVAKRGEPGGVEITHDEAAADPGLALLLARCTPPEFPTPIGVLRSVEEATFEDQTLAQNRAAIAARGEGTLRELLYAGDRWDV